MDRKYDKYRLLDIDDLIILKMLGEDCKHTEIGLVLRLTPPAISARIRRYKRIWEDFYIRTPRSGYRVREYSDSFYDAHRMACLMLDALAPQELAEPGVSAA